MTEQDALELLWVAGLAGDTHGKGWHHVGVPDSGDGWIRTTDRKTFMWLVPELGWEHNATLTVLPKLGRGEPIYSTDSALVWARTESRDATARLRRFKPMPTLALRDGASCRYTAFWALSRAFPPVDVERVNRHIAHKLGCPKKNASPLFAFRPPGAVDRSKKRPVPIVVAGGSGEVVTMREVCRTLPRKLPDPDAWRSPRVDAYA